LPYSDFFKTAGERAKSYPAIPAWGPLVENLVTRDNLYAFWKRLAALGRTEGLVSEAEQRSRESLVLAALLSAQVEINRDLSIGKLSAWLPWVAAALAGLSLVTVFSLWRRCVDRRRSRLALAESEAKFRDLYDHAPDMFCSVDVADGRIVECNQTLVSKSGYSKEEIVGRPVFDLYHPECRDRARRALQSFRETGHLDELELELQTRDGQRLAVSVGVSAIRDQKGNIVRTRSVWRDISRRKHAEEVAEQRRQELAYVARLATVGELAASLAHELDQPLTAVVANAQAGMRLIVREPPSLRKVGEILHDIAGEGQRAAQVIKALRDLLRKDDLQMTEVDINEVIKDILSSLRGQPSLRKVALLLHLETGLPHILGDRIQLEQVVLNLILNAAEAMQGVEGGAGELKIRTSASALGEVEVTVWDTGVGMDEAAKEKIFDAFFTTKPGALGMGLSISRTIIEAHGGRIWATRNPDRGATLHFTLPSRSDQRPIS
jgi:PAS domain S-box-containing protein